MSRSERVESFKNMLVAQATGGGGDERLYALVRRELMEDAPLAQRVPRFVRTCRNLGEFWEFIKSRFGTYAERRAYLRQEFEPLLNYLEGNEQGVMSQTADLALQSMTAEAIGDLWRRMLDRRERDPEGAITAGRTLVESVCKHILDDLGEPYDDSAELPALFKTVAVKLNLAPEQHMEPTFKQILGGCVSIVNGLAALRNRLSDAHGKGPRAARPSARHAELAVNVAGTASAFLISTWTARKE